MQTPLQAQMFAATLDDLTAVLNDVQRRLTELAEYAKKVEAEL
jgi:hypothetical protein